jgi:hypothetical protein
MALLFALFEVTNRLALFGDEVFRLSRSLLCTGFGVFTAISVVATLAVLEETVVFVAFKGPARD